MSRDLCSAIRGSSTGTIVGLVFGIATLSSIGFDRITLFEGGLLVSCSIFGGVLFGAIIGVTGAFQKPSGEPATTSVRTALHSARVS